MNQIKLNEIQAREIVSGYKARFVHTENLTIVYWDVKAGSSLPEHSHLHEQVTSLIEGEFELTVDGEKQILLAGGVLKIPPHAKHSATAITDCRLIDVFYPCRKDYQ